MIVLIDTSVWLRFLRGEEAGLVARPWITSGQALVHPFVVGELLLGGLSAENEALLRSLPWSAPPPPEALYDFVRRHNLAGTGIGWVDAALLAAARGGGRPACHLRHSPRPLRPPSGCSHPCNVAGERSVARGVTAKDGSRPAVFWSARRTVQSATDTCRFGNDLLYSAHA